MFKFAAVVGIGTAVVLIGILTWTPLVVVSGTLAACAGLLLALITFFEHAT